MRNWGLSLILVSATAVADPIERDRQSAEFARPELRALHAEQEMRRSSRPDERQVQARERDAVPLVERPAPSLQYYRPLPLPGGARHGVDPIAVPGSGS